MIVQAKIDVRAIHVANSWRNFLATSFRTPLETSHYSVEESDDCHHLATMTVICLLLLHNYHFQNSCSLKKKWLDCSGKCAVVLLREVGELIVFDTGGFFLYNGLQHEQGCPRTGSMSRKREVGMPARDRSRRRPKEPSQQEVAEQLAGILRVTDEAKRAELLTIVQTLGRTQARMLAEEALQFEGGEEEASSENGRLATFLRLVQTKGKPKERPWLRVKEVATRIAEQLGEVDVIPLSHLQRIVQILGEEQALHYLEETLRVEEAGGMLVADGSRRRTLGGVYFALMKEAVSPEIRHKLFPLPGSRRQRKARSGREQPTPARPVVLSSLLWDDRWSIIAEAQTSKGQASTMKITIIGRPGKVVERGGCVATMVEAANIPALPKGLPTPPQSSTAYLLYISTKQWKKVAEAIQDEEDRFIAEGFPYLDQKAGHIAVLVTSITTKKVQQAQRQAQQVASGTQEHTKSSAAS